MIKMIMIMIINKNNFKIQVKTTPQLRSKIIIIRDNNNNMMYYLQNKNKNKR